MAKFEARSNLEKYHDVTGIILSKLTGATAEYKDVKVKVLDRTIGNREGRAVAREEGKKHNAEIVIWGWYNKSETTALISANFEVLVEKTRDFFEPSQKAQGEGYTASIAELKSFQVQMQLSEEMTYLTLVTLGLSRYIAEDWDVAITQLTDALKLAKETVLNPATIYFYRGTAYYHKQNYNKAIVDYTQALHLDPSSAVTYYNRGTAHAHQQEYDEAIVDYTQALHLDPDYAKAYGNRGAAYLDRQEYDAAIANYTQVLRLNRNNAIAYCNRGSAYIYKQKYDQAISDCNRAIELDSNLVEAYYNRGNAYARKQDYNEAMVNYDHAIKLNPNLAPAYYNRGCTHSRTGDRQNAVKDLNKALKLTSDPKAKQLAEKQLRELGEQYVYALPYCFINLDVMD
ncbi:tetratricopeptide repeat protein [Lusitaniella coriacea]|uniref:tetratricopeptide repeat protein n=1 Tax=Lusitaniella coriacea TaxID=1983105 RepID=UPI003CE6C737